MANFFKTAYFENGVICWFKENALPKQAQFSPVLAITSLDFNRSREKDWLFCGNISQARLRFRKYDASYGILLQGESDGYSPMFRGHKEFFTWQVMYTMSSTSTMHLYLV